MAVAALAELVGVSLQTGPGETIPVIGFGQLTLFFTLVGVVIAGSSGGGRLSPGSRSSGRPSP
jgi:hypothetical protein